LCPRFFFFLIKGKYINSMMLQWGWNKNPLQSSELPKWGSCLHELDRYRKSGNEQKIYS
jgi:hypothetical protein